LLLQAKRNDQALKELNAALELLDTLSPNEESLESLGESRNRVLATVHHNIGQLLAQSDPDSAVPHFEKAIELRLELAKVKNNRFRTAPELVASYVELGNLFLKHDQNAKAAESFRNANDVSERLLTILPKQQQVMRTNAIAQTNLGIALYRINRRTDGVKNLEAGIASLKELIELNRDRTSLQIDLALAMNNLARMLVDMGQHSEAMATYERAESLLAAQQNFPAKVQLQMIYQSHLESANRMGNTTKADQLKSLLRQANESHQVPFDAGASL
jgi:tetratricopeptide (TPR) repeat protein